jgi:malonate transporter
MMDLLAHFLPFFALVLMGWSATRKGLLALEGIGTLNTFVLFFALPALVFRLAASGALHQPGLAGLLLVYGLAGGVIVGLGLLWSRQMRLGRRDGGLAALVTVFPNTGFLGLPLLTGLLGSQVAGPVAATMVVDVLFLSSLCLAWAHSHVGKQAPGGDQHEAWHAALASLKGALRNPMLWAMALGMGVSELALPMPEPLDATLRLLGLAATPVALFTLGAVLARSGLQRAALVPVSAQASYQAVPSAALVWPVLLKLVVHPALVCGLGWGVRRAGLVLPDAGLLALTLAAALPSASNVSMLAEREGADTALIARIIMWTTALALATLVAWSAWLGVATPPA